MLFVLVPFTLALITLKLVHPVNAQGPWCQVNLTGCPNALGIHIFVDGNGVSRPYDRCLPAGQRQRTLNGCLCQPSYAVAPPTSLESSVDLQTYQALLPNVNATQYFNGTCNLTVNAPGGSWCFVSPGTCTTLPSKSSTNTSLGEEFDSGWDYCTDPAYDQERASELASMTDSYIMIAKYRHINHTTQAGCQCSPIDWTHYPADGSPGRRYLGCANPDKDPKGPWCVVNPMTCPSYYGQAVSKGSVVQGHDQFTYYYDYCAPVRSVTESGCLCQGTWWTNDTSPVSYSGGICANPAGSQHKDRPWCYVDYLTCRSEPAGYTDRTKELHWDYCQTTPSTANTTPTITGQGELITLPSIASNSTRGVGMTTGTGTSAQPSNASSTVPISVGSPPDPGHGSGVLFAVAVLIPLLIAAVTVTAVLLCKLIRRQHGRRVAVGYVDLQHHGIEFSSNSTSNPPTAARVHDAVNSRGLV
eukprot:jgi/Chrzof1/9790/Cz04g15250.t1